MAAFRHAMDADFDNAGALGVLFDAVREGNRRLDAGDDAEPWIAAYDEITGMFGLSEPVVDLSDIFAALDELATEVGAPTAPMGGDVIDALLVRRAEARTGRDWATADAIRDRLGELGIVIEDTADGARWHRR